MQQDPRSGHRTNGASGFVCPRCGGAIWDHDDGAAISFECRIGDRFSEAEMWVEHSAARNQALLVAARALAENAALARRIAASAQRRGDAEVAARLEQEARDDDQLYVRVRGMVEGLADVGTDGAT
jgi:two-component system, chemotaxis family, protein-glutamate methylesterase/glutaminase